MNKKIIGIIIVVIIFIGLGVYFALNIEEVEQYTPATGPITISGELACLPKIITRRDQTAECIRGLKGTDGRYYGLRSLFDLIEMDQRNRFLKAGLQFEISGTFSPEEIIGPDGNKYDIVGVIDVVSFTVTSF